jgi:hypothetical protein
MPGLLGYMVAIVVTLGGYLAGLHWLVSPPDPWQSNPKTAQLLQQTPRKRLPPVATPAEASATPAASAEPDIRLARVETAASAQAGVPGTVRPAEPNGVQTTRPTLDPARIVRHEVSPPKIRPSRRNRVEKETSHKLEMMVLRTYERSDGKRFTRLLPLSAVPNTMAFQPDDQW